jgi:hypothetical protein
VHPEEEKISGTSCNFKNLLQVDTSAATIAAADNRRILNLCLLNPCSICNKAADICDFTIDNKLDICVLTETWLRGNDRDNVIIEELKPPGYSVHHIARDGRGGGVAVLYRDCLSVTPSVPHKYSSFEHLECVIKTVPPIRLVTIYRPPPSKVNRSNFRSFIDEIGSYFEYLVATPGILLALGDFNIHVENHHDKEGLEFLQLLDSFGLKQHVGESTHRSGHTLDLVITKSQDSLVPNVRVEDHRFPDHYPVFCQLPLYIDRPTKRRITYRKVKSIDPGAFITDIEKSNIMSVQNDDSTIDDTIELYNSVLSSILNVHAPEKSRIVPMRPLPEWYNDDIRAAKQEKRRCERLWRKTKLTVHKILFDEKRAKIRTLIAEAKSNYFKNVIAENSGDSKKLFSVVNNLLGKRKEPTLPANKEPKDLAEEFCTYFHEKIERIRAGIIRDGQTTHSPDHTIDLPCSLDSFRPTTGAEVVKIIMSSPPKSCSLDPLPTTLLKQCLQPLTDIISKIVNKSLVTATVPESFKMAQVTPLIKKPSLDPSQLSNYRPVSNLPFLSKVLEKVVSAQLVAYLSENGLGEPLQSAYRKQHSTETALLRIHHDILEAMSGQKACLMVLLDLSAAFDTVDHRELLRTLEDLGIRGSALNWLESYLTERHQKVCIGSKSSAACRLQCGVPQGSVLGPILFTIYTSSLGQLLRSHGMEYHLYADDSSVYTMFKPQDVTGTIDRIQDCICAVRQWMAMKSLKMNDSKTEFLLISSKQLYKRVDCPSIVIGDSDVSVSKSAKLLGVWLDKHISMEDHVSAVCKSAQYHLYNIRKIRRHLSTESTEQLIHAFITTKLDYCNSLFCGLPASQLNRLQRLQNIAARIVTRSKPSCHITPILCDLHWLPVCKRVTFKILLLVYKCQNGIAPPYLQELISSKRSSRSLRSADHQLLHIPFTRNGTFADRAFGVAGPRLWNDLPLEIRTVSTVETFKSKLKTFLFKEHYGV